MIESFVKLILTGETGAALILFLLIIIIIIILQRVRAKSIRVIISLEDTEDND